MIDNFALAISHGLIALAVWLLLRRSDLDHEPVANDLPTSAAERPVASSWAQKRFPTRRWTAKNRCGPRA